VVNLLILVGSMRAWTHPYFVSTNGAAKKYSGPNMKFVVTRSLRTASGDIARDFTLPLAGVMRLFFPFSAASRNKPGILDNDFIAQIPNGF